MLQEDADAVGLSVLSGAHMTLFAQVVEALRARGLDDVVVFGGGIVPDDDLPRLAEIGVAACLHPWGRHGLHHRLARRARSTRAHGATSTAT